MPIPPRTAASACRATVSARRFTTPREPATKPRRNSPFRLSSSDSRTEHHSGCSMSASVSATTAPWCWKRCRHHLLRWIGGGWNWTIAPWIWPWPGRNSGAVGRHLFFRCWSRSAITAVGITDAAAAASVMPTAVIADLLQHLKNRCRPTAPEFLPGQGQIQGAMVQFQPPPIQRRRWCRQRFQHHGAVVAETDADIEHPEWCSVLESLELSRNGEFRLGFVAGSRGVVKRLAETVALQAEAAVRGGIGMQLPEISCAVGQGRPRRSGRTRPRRHFGPGSSPRSPAWLPPPDSSPPCDRFHCRVMLP